MKKYTIKEMQEAHKQGKRIQFYNLSGDWVFVYTPAWAASIQYRIHPDDIEKEDKKMNVPHKHAATIKAWADGAAIEFRRLNHTSSSWSMTDSPIWLDGYEYRIKRNTIKIGDVEINAPLPITAKREVVYIVSLFNDGFVLRANSPSDVWKGIARQIAHDTPEDAIAHAKALLKVSGGMK